MVRTGFSLLAALLCCAALAGPTPAPVRAEINLLLDRLQNSGCQFNRNGTWGSGAQARAHLLRKLNHLEGEVTLKSTEQFIELAASTSSVSGKPYEVQCTGKGTMTSAEWLQKELVFIRLTRS